MKILQTVKRKGISKTAKRVWLVYRRYAFGNFEKSLSTMLDILEKYDAKVTFPITGVTLERNEDFIKRYIDRKIEWALHGYVHVDHRNLDPQVLEEHIKKGVCIFKKMGIKLQGFRAPYLSFNESLLPILHRYDFLYDSSRSFFVRVINVNEPSIQKGLNHYKPIKKWKIEKISGVVEIPVLLPDDEFLVDRLGYKSEKIGKIWIKEFEEILKIGGVPVLQIHPERGKICAKALEMLLEWIYKKDLNTEYLSDIAMGKRERAVALSGDIDIIKLGDLRYMKEGR